jgi:hypothetical protein
MSILLHNERERVAVATFTPFDMAAAWNGSKMDQLLVFAHAKLHCKQREEALAID